MRRVVLRAQHGRIKVGIKPSNIVVNRSHLQTLFTRNAVHVNCDCKSVLMNFQYTTIFV